MTLDNRTKEYFSNIKQVFLYLSDQCNLMCDQCLYKPNIVRGESIPFETAVLLLKEFRKLGAFKLTLLGGEISLYDCENQHKKLIDILQLAHSIGYEYVRIDTNGQKQSFFEQLKIFELLDEISFSIDGYDAQTNDALRGPGAYDNAMASLRLLKSHIPSAKVNITTCVTKQNTALSGGIVPFIENMIQFALSNHVTQLNIHGVFKMGVPMDVWTGDSHLDPIQWYEAVQTIRENIAMKKYPIDVRLPVHIISKSEFEKHPRYYGYCPCKLGERALIHPDGIIRVCSSMLSTPYGVAHYNREKACWNEFNNELQRHDMSAYTPCTNQQALYSENFCPVCFSIKPFQNEIVWERSHIEALKGDSI